MTIRRELIKILPPTVARSALDAWPIAHAKLQRWRSSAVFIGVTGSSGKSTTSALLSHLLSGCSSVGGQTMRNTFEATVRTLRTLRSDHNFIVCEIGTAAPGMVRRSARLLKPSIGIVTLVGLEHYTAFRSCDAIAREKGALIESLPADGLAILNYDDPRVAAMAETTRARVITFGGPGADYACEDVRATRPGELHVRLSGGGQVFELTSKLTGSHNSLAVAAAVACAHSLGVGAAKIIERVATFEPIFGRCSVHIIENGPIFIADTMKAPYGTVTLPFEMLRNFEAPRKRVVIGQISDFAGNPKPKYRHAYRSALAVADEVIFVGDNSHRSTATQEEILNGRFHRAMSVEALSNFLKQSAIPGEIILVKSARNLHLERLILHWQEDVKCWIDQCGKKGSCLKCGRYLVRHEFSR